MKWLTPFFCFLTFATIISAYTISGKISEKKGNPIPAAHIYLPSEQTGTTADIDGNYTIDVGPGVHKFEISALGYLNIDTSFNVSGDKVIDFIMHSQAMVGDVVVVSASRIEQSILDTPISTTVAKGDILSARATAGMDDAMKYIPGITMNKYQISIRNSSGYSQGCGSRVAMLIDGVPVTSGDTGEIKWDALPTNAVSQVEIVKGAGSALYGSGALGGVVNIVTLKPSKIFDGSGKSVELKVFSKFGAYDKPHWDDWVWTNRTLTLKGGGFLWGKKIGKTSYLATADMTQSDSYRQNDDFFRGKSFLKLHHDISDNRSITTFVNLAYEDRGSYFEWRSPEEALLSVVGRENDRVWSSKAFGALIYKGDNPAKHLFFQGKLYDIFNNWSSRIFNVNTQENEQEASKGNKIGADAQLIFTWNKQIISGGGEFSFLNNTSVTFGDHYGWGGAVYIQDELSYFHPLVIDLGGRFDLFWIDSSSTDFFIGVSPKVSAIYHITEHIAAHANLSSGFRIPNMAELFTRTNAGGVLRVEPNPDLEPEQGYTSEAGFNMANDKYILTCAAFYNFYSDMIEPTPIYGTLVKFTNFRRVQIYGAEISGNTRIGRLNFNGGYMFTSSTDMDSGDKLPYRPDHSVTLSAGYAVIDSLTLGADFRYKSKIGYGLYKADLVVDQKVLDLYSRWRIGPIAVSARVNNALNYNYTEIERNIAPIRHYVLSLEYDVF